MLFLINKKTSFVCLNSLTLGMRDINLAKLRIQLLVFFSVTQFPKSIFFFPEGLTISILIGELKLKKIVQLIWVFSCKTHPANMPSGTTDSKCSHEKF